MCNKCLENGGKGGAGRCEGWPIDNTRVVTYGPRVIPLEAGAHPSIGRVIHVPDQKPRVTINNNIPNSSVTVQEVDGEIIVTITEAPKHEEFNKR